jgi:ribosome-associated translation inhibitor RaiA
MEDDRMKTFNTEEMVTEAASEIERFAPKNSQLEIDVKEDPVGHFRTYIKLSTKTKIYFAKKEDSFLYKSFSKAIRAIKAQVQKKRTNHLRHKISLKNKKFSMP